MRSDDASRGALFVGLAFGMACGGEAEVGYRLEPVDRRTVVAAVEAQGQLEARGVRVVVAGVEARLEAVLVRAGDRLEEGQPLAKLDDRALAAEAAATRAGLAAAAAGAEEAALARDEAAAELARVERLATRGQASDAVLATARGAKARADANARRSAALRDQARARLDAARAAYDAATVLSPGPLVVLSVPDQLGAMVSPRGPPLFRLADPLETLVAVARVGEVDIGRLAVAQRGTVEVPAFLEEAFPGSITHLDVAPAPGDARYRVQLEVENPDRRLLPGMSAMVRFEVGRAEGLAVREAALRFVPDGAPPGPPRSRVFRRRDRTIEPVEVEAGVSDGVYVEVRGPLAPGDQVVVGRAPSGEGASGARLSLGGR